MGWLNKKNIWSIGGARRGRWLCYGIYWCKIWNILCWIRLIKLRTNYHLYRGVTPSLIQSSFCDWCWHWILWHWLLNSYWSQHRISPHSTDRLNSISCVINLYFLSPLRQLQFNWITTISWITTMTMSNIVWSDLQHLHDPWRHGFIFLKFLCVGTGVSTFSSLFLLLALTLVATDGYLWLLIFGLIGFGPQQPTWSHHSANSSGTGFASSLVPVAG